MARRLGTERLGEHRQPFAHRRRLVVDDVVDAGLGALECDHRRGGGIVEVDPRDHPGAVADDRELPLAHRLDQAVVRGAVERAVAQHDPARGGHGLLEVAHRRVRRVGPRDRPRIERVVLGLDHRALARVPHAREALRDEPLDARLAGRGEQPVRALGPQPVGRHKAAVQVARELRAGERGRLVDDAVGRDLLHRLAHRAGVEQVELPHLGSERAQPRVVARRPVRADHLVTAFDELRDERGADRAACSDNEDSHQLAPWVMACVPAWMTRGGRSM